MTIKLTRFDAAEYLTDPEDQMDLLNDALASGDPAFVAHALGTIARARGIGSIEQATGLNRKQLYRSLSDKGNPTLATLLKVTKALGIDLAAQKPAAA